jgi:NAD-dependent SIR2 family protein deacetylase
MKHGFPAELKRLYSQGRVLPFVGAGASMSVSWMVGGVRKTGPSWSEMVDQAARILGFKSPELLHMRGTDLQILEYFRIKKSNFAPLTNWMVRLMDAPDDAIRSSKVHTALSRLSQCNIFYTTNYDDFLEKALVTNGRDVQVIATEGDMGFNSSATQVIKFHGDFNNPDEMVVSEVQYYRRMKLESPMDLKLRSDLFGRAVLFLGYSFRDINVAYLFQNVNEMFSQLPHSFSGKRAYITVHNPSDFENRLFHARNIEVIPTFGDDRAAATAEILEELAA